jgi:hypothetical protein
VGLARQPKPRSAPCPASARKPQREAASRKPQAASMIEGPEAVILATVHPLGWVECVRGSNLAPVPLGSVGAGHSDRRPAPGLAPLPPPPRTGGWGPAGG